VAEFYQLSNREDDAILYQLRNTLLHSFGLYSKRKERIYKFSMAVLERSLVTQTSEEDYLINHKELFLGWERSLDLYLRALQTSSELQAKFIAIMPNYGITHIGPVNV
jgi:hypothetical protein